MIEDELNEHLKDFRSRLSNLHDKFVQEVARSAEGNCNHKQYDGKPFYLTWDGKCPKCGDRP